ncbi:PREDICTED: prostatic acid phosphatase-like [Branchiostoma belcheri]|uniref:Prostatic acid phosphatase-like n=1 Tax=Branchiostoma belcheri TaxID=7741 RepID=A0A6P5ATN9_BRABE|nr:PREDICTED: prostatic acid phosphatase-like [Branchiostoma belcheri]
MCHVCLQVYRHGDRSPVLSFPNDNNTEDTWPQGFGQLSQEGMRQHHELGTFLKDRYVKPDFLNSSYSRYQIHVQSTDVDRTLMSAQADLSGLFPPAGDQVWNPDIDWQPIPVHTRPVKTDEVLRPMDVPCPKYTKLTAEFLQTDPELKRLEEENKEFLANVTRWANWSSPQHVMDTWQTADPLHCEKAHNRPLPGWATPEVYARLQELSAFGMFSLFRGKERSRLTGGTLLGEMVKNMTQAKEGTLPDSRLKLIMYSAHDTTLAALHSALGTVNSLQPPYASCVMVELYREDSGEFTVEVWYRNDTSRDPYQLTVPGCPNPCSYTQFLNATRDSVPVDRAKECQLGVTDIWTIQVIAGVAAGAFIVMAIGIFVLVGCVRRYKRRDQYLRDWGSSETI